MTVLQSLAYSAPTSIGRRQFLGVAASAAAWLPARTAWADLSGPAAVPAQIAAVSVEGKPVTLTGAEVKELRAALGGKLLLAQDAGYEQARRVWNGSIDRHPALIARCHGRADIVHAVQFAAAHSLLTAVKGGGHSISGQSTCEGGLMIDLSPMRAIELDSDKRRVRAQPGVLLAALDAKCQSAGLVTPLGTAADTGIAGLTLGGGQGRLMRTLGLSCDNVNSFELVTADGKVHVVGASDNPDLYWALRGGGGNFGVVSGFEYRLHPLAHPVLAGGRVYPISQARSVVKGMVDIAAGAPDELYVSGSILNASGDGKLPQGTYVAVEFVYSGDPSAGARLLPALDKLGKPLNDTIAAKPYVVAQNGPTGAAPPALPPGMGVYVRSGFAQSIPDKFLDAWIHAFQDGPPWLDEIGLGPIGGQVARIKPNATAYWNRAAQYEFIVIGAWTDHSQDEHNIAVMRDLWKVFEPFTQGYYVNTEPSAAESRLKATYGDNYARLVQLKDRYDPKNLFRMNANIRPTQA
ncbi:MAG TPA: FAD-binding oxidoreductase [Steroidobacteraceae bacterium]|nr:FAD-binding oxidoreductase [Steroidobacteraceae bacterium]